MPTEADNAFIAVIEDDEDIRESVALALEDEGFEVGEAKNGAEGLELVAKREPCLVLLDLMMPVLDGRGFLERFRREQRFSEVPVIVISAQNTPVPEGAQDFLRKPFDIERLLAVVEQHCG